MPRCRSTSIPVVGLLLAALLAAGCSAAEQPARELDRSPLGQRPPPRALLFEPSDVESPAAGRTRPTGGRPLTLAFAGDVHFEGGLAGLPRRERSTLGPMSEHLRDADLAMVNLESALIRNGRRTSKELEVPEDRYWFRTPPAALGLFARSGVDVVTVANNHGADFGAAGVRQTLRAARDSKVAVVGVGGGARQAFQPHRVTIRGTHVSVLAADASRRESNNPAWAAGEGGPGIASARANRPRRLLAAVRKAHARGDVVVVYLHWGRSLDSCPTDFQRRLAEGLAAAGADVVVGAHAHVLQGAGMLGDTYVSYGLGNFAWYHGARSRTGVLELRVRDGRVVADRFMPARIPAEGGRPDPVDVTKRSAARAAWERLRGCTDLAPTPTERGSRGDRAPTGGDLPPYEGTVRKIGSALRERMTGSGHDAASCPVALAELRRLKMSYIGFDGRKHTGVMVVHADHADDVVGVFRRLYRARWPIRRMRLVSEYGGNDNRSMAANNTSGYNCRRVAGQDSWSRHAYGAAIDINPVQNPYLTAAGVLPPAGRRFAEVDRSAGARTEPGLIRPGDVVVRAFQDIGWTWGGTWSRPDYQHFAAR